MFLANSRPSRNCRSRDLQRVLLETEGSTPQMLQDTTPKYLDSNPVSPNSKGINPVPRQSLVVRNGFSSSILVPSPPLRLARLFEGITPRLLFLRLQLRRQFPSLGRPLRASLRVVSLSSAYLDTRQVTAWLSAELTSAAAAALRLASSASDDPPALPPPPPPSVRGGPPIFVFAPPVGGTGAVGAEARAGGAAESRRRPGCAKGSLSCLLQRPPIFYFRKTDGFGKKVADLVMMRRWVVGECVEFWPRDGVELR